MQTPSKKVIYFLIFATLIVTGTISYSVYQERKPVKIAAEETEKNLAIVVDNQYKNTDTDADGLFDWEETLWQTDPKNADTDKDGTKDGQEVALSRDPNKAGPNDVWTPNNYLEQYVIETKIDPNSLTSRVAQNLLIAVGQNDNPNIAAELLAQIQAEIKTTQVFKKENLITFDDANKEKVQEYANAFIAIYQKEISEGELIPENNQKAYADVYKKMALSLSTIPVPNSLAGVHTNYINNLNNMSVFTTIIVQAESDPIKMVAVIPEFEKILGEQIILLEQIKTYMQSNAIIFTINA